MQTFNNCRHAITAGNAMAPRVIAWAPALSAWVLYCPTNPPAKVEPDLLCYSAGTVPLALSDAGRTIIRQLLPL